MTLILLTWAVKSITIPVIVDCLKTFSENMAIVMMVIPSPD